MRLIVADAGPLIIFGKTCGIDLLKSVVSEILVPPAVLMECTADAEKPGAKAIQAAIDNGALTALPQVDLSGASQKMLLLHRGELEAIAAAKEHQCAVLLDEVVGRSVARASGVPVTGSLGILLLAKERGLIDRVGPIIAQWKAAKYYLSDRMVAELLQRVGVAKGLFEVPDSIDASNEEVSRLFRGGEQQS
jgi:predicted nucleic acid-binding protein